jgi:hypothetical protein
MPVLDVNLDDVPERSYEPLPAGWYEAVITESEEKENKKKDGSYIQLKFQIFGPSHNGRVIFGRLNLNNPNDQAVGIARQDLKAIVMACGLARCTSTEQLHDIPLMIKLTVKPGDGNYEPSNEIRGYKAVDKGGNVPPKPNATTATTASQKPWQRK